MQAISPVTSSDLKGGYQLPKIKLEIYYSGAWVDLTNLGGVNYLKSINLSLGGASMTPDPIAGAWSAIIDNDEGHFYPANTGGAYYDYFKTGRKVRISTGSTYGGVDYYWQRIIGYMDSPSFDASVDGQIYLKGLDYMQMLADVKLKKPDNYWGSSITLNSIASSGAGAGAEIYAEADAMEIGAGEANNVTPWTINVGCAVSSVADVGGGSTWVMNILSYTNNAYTKNINVGSFVQGTEYKVTFKYNRESGSGTLRAKLLRIYSTNKDVRYGTNLYSGGRYGKGTLQGQSPVLSEETWTTVTFYFVATETTTMSMVFELSTSGDNFRVDEISITALSNINNPRYALPAEATGVYYVVLDGAPIWYGVLNEGWFYDSDSNEFYFDPNKRINDGTGNLVIYYYTAQEMENVLADLLVSAGLYSYRTDALSMMDYTVTGISVDRVWFNAGINLLYAIRLICERCDYRFYFEHDGTPNFNPKPTVKSWSAADFELVQSEIANPIYYEDSKEIRNKIIIEGEANTQDLGPEQAMNPRVKGTNSSASSIAAYGEKSFIITNHLFQDQTSIDDMIDELLDEYATPKKYFDVVAGFNPVPLEIGDTLRIQVRISKTYQDAGYYGQSLYGVGTYNSNGTIILHKGIIRDIKIDQFNITFKCEEA